MNNGNPALSQTPINAPGSNDDASHPGWRKGNVLKADLASADDARLAEALIAGEPRAMRIAWERFAPVVRRMVKRRLGSRSDVEDVAQDVFTILFERVATLRDPGALKSFATSIAAFRIQTELRKRRRERDLARHALVYLDIARVTHPDAEARQAVSRFGNLLERLKPEERTIFVLRFVKGASLINVARATGLSLSTVKRRLGAVWRRVSLLVSRDPFLARYLPMGARGHSTDDGPEPPERDVA
jgi:RNA polymerase sigma-70 factor (ECF subfamily)